MENKKNKLKIITPEEGLNKFFKWFDKRKQLAFFVTLLAGILTHITMITETIMSQDGLWNSMKYARSGDWELTLGRWGIEVIERLTNFIAIPTISTIFCIVAMAIAAVLLIDLFEFKSKISIIITSLILVLTPTLTATLLYVYTSFAYCFNMIFAILSVYFIYKLKNKKVGILLSSICFMFSLSIYQSYVGVTVGLCMMITIIDILKGEKDLKEIFKNVLNTVISVILGGFLYFIVTNCLLLVSNLELSAYKGAESVGLLDIVMNLKYTIIQAYKDFIVFFIRDRIVYNTNYRRDIGYMIFFAVLGISVLIKLKSINGENKKVKIAKCALVIGIGILLPLGLNIIDILASETEIYSLTAVQMILMIPFSFAIFELLDKQVILKWISLIVCLIIMVSYYIADNTSYAALKLTYNQAYSTTVRIMDRIENTSGYQKDMPILFGGIVGNNNYPRTSNLYNYTIGSVANNVVFHGTYSGQIGTWESFLKIFFGLDVTLCQENVYYDIVNSDFYKDMEIFPSQDSVKIKDGIVVVKLSDDPPMPY